MRPYYDIRMQIKSDRGGSGEYIGESTGCTGRSTERRQYYADRPGDHRDFGSGRNYPVNYPKPSQQEVRGFQRILEKLIFK